MIDPIFNPTAKLADRYISVKPGMDGWLAAAVLKVLIETGRTDETFISEHSVGFDDVKEFLKTVSLEEFIVKTETSMEELEYLAGLYADGPVSTFMGLGMQRYKNGGERFVGLMHLLRQAEMSELRAAARISEMSRLARALQKQS